jgi:LysM repeat protein
MVDRSSARRSPARYLVPLALAATGVATYLVVQHGLRTSAGSVGSTHRAHHAHASQHPRHLAHRSAGPTTYVVRSGDTLGTIAQRFGVSVAQIELLNPHLNANALQVGQSLRLRQ